MSLYHHHIPTCYEWNWPHHRCIIRDLIVGGSYDTYYCLNTDQNVFLLTVCAPANLPFCALVQLPQTLGRSDFRSWSHARLLRRILHRRAIASPNIRTCGNRVSHQERALWLGAWWGCVSESRYGLHILDPIATCSISTIFCCITARNPDKFCFRSISNLAYRLQPVSPILFKNSN